MHSISTPNPIILRRARLALLAACGSLLLACSGNDEIRSEVQNITEAYEIAQTAVSRKNYRRAIQIFEAIQARFPFSDLSRQIQLELLHAYYKSGSFEQAAEAAGVKTVLIPRRNEKDLVDVPEEVREELDLRLVDDINAVLDIALEASTA